MKGAMSRQLTRHGTQALLACWTHAPCCCRAALALHAGHAASAGGLSSCPQPHARMGQVCGALAKQLWSGLTAWVARRRQLPNRKRIAAYASQLCEYEVRPAAAAAAAAAAASGLLLLLLLLLLLPPPLLQAGCCCCCGGGGGGGCKQAAAGLQAGTKPAVS